MRESLVRLYLQKSPFPKWYAIPENFYISHSGEYEKELNGQFGKKQHSGWPIIWPIVKMNVVKMILIIYDPELAQFV